MALKTFKPTSQGRRGQTAQTFDEVTAKRPERGLTEARKRTSGRNNLGRITVRHRGGGCKRHYRKIDFRREKTGIPARVANIEYDPNRSARIALLHYVDGEKRYILAPERLRVGMILMSGPDAEPSVGNALPLERIPLGLPVHNVELNPGRGGKLARSAGNSVQVMGREGGMAQVRMPSGEIRTLNARCLATIGQVGNSERSGVMLGKAGRKRWMGIRPTVRGVVMNPVDHPMGGGEGRSSGGGQPCSPWGKLAKSGKTRKRRNPTNKFIVKRRK